MAADEDRFTRTDRHRRFTALDEQALRGLARNPDGIFYNGLSAEGKRRVNRLIDFRLAVVLSDGTCVAVQPAPPPGDGLHIIEGGKS